MLWIFLWIDIHFGRLRWRPRVLRGTRVWCQHWVHPRVRASVFKSTCCCFRETGFHSQNPKRHFNGPYSSNSGRSMALLVLTGTCKHVMCIHVHTVGYQLVIINTKEKFQRLKFKKNWIEIFIILSHIISCTNIQTMFLLSLIS